MKATLETVTGITINRDIDASDTPMSIMSPNDYEELYRRLQQGELQMAG